jgi:hypothetical protein
MGLIGVHAIESKKFIGFAEPPHALDSQGRAKLAHTEFSVNVALSKSPCPAPQ